MIRVLHVDDEPDFADMAATFLEREQGQIDVQTATNPTEGLDILADNTVDCIISDYDMPCTNGLEFLETVRDEYPDLPFILYTGKGSEEIAADAISAGVTDYLQKEGNTDQYTVLANRVVNAVERYRTEHEVRQTRAQFEAISKNSTDPIVIIDADSRIQFANPAVEDHFGYTPSELEGEHLTTIMPQRYHEDHLAAVDRYLGTGEQSVNWRNVEFSGLRKDGTEVPLSVSYGEFQQDGEPRFVGIMRDISEQTRLEEKLREREEQERELARTKRAMDEAPVGITITDPAQADNPVIYVNDRFQELTGYSEAEILGRNCRFLQGEATDPEPVAKMREAVDNEERGSVELRNYQKDGTEFWSQVTIAPVRDDDGSVINYVGFQQDISGQRRRQRVLREMYNIISDRRQSFEDQVQSLLELGRTELNTEYGTLSEINGDEYVFKFVATDDDSIQSGDIVPVSATTCELVASSEESIVIGDIERDAPEQTDRVGFTQWGISCYLGAPVFAGDELYGTFCFYGTEGRSNQFSEWEVTLVDLMSRWVSYELQHREAIEQLQQTNERLEQFASIVSHDLRNPLNVAEGRLELANEECDSEHLDAIGLALDRMDTLITDLLALAREGDSTTDITAIRLATLTENCWRNVDTADASIVADIDRTIRADKGRLSQLFENLIRNAIEHGGDEVTVRVGELDDGFYIEDDGSGIPDGERDDVFDAGYSTSDKGTGFGLSIVKQVVDAHDWEIHVTEGTEGGERFEITGVEFAAE